MHKPESLTAIEYRKVFDSMDSGFCVIEMLIDPEKPIDYLFLEVNPAFEKQARLNHVKGKRMRELRPDLEEYWYEIYRDVAVTGKPARFEQRVHILDDTWYEVYAFPVGDPLHKRIAVIFNDISDNKKIRDSLRKSQEILSAAFDNSPYALLLTRADDGLILNANEAFLELLGMKSNEVLGKTSLALNMYSNPSDRERIMSILESKGRIRNFELCLRNSSGQKIPVLFSIELLTTEDSLNMLTTIQDISSRKNTERILRESEELFRNLFERHGSIMLIIEQESGQILDANKAAARFYGYSREQMRTMNISQINSLPGSEVEEERNKVTKEEKEYFQFPHQLANGETKWVEVHSSPIQYHGRILLFSVINDISVQKRIASELIKSELRYRSTFENAAVGMALVDRKGKWIQVNNRLCSITGYTPEELKELTFTDITHPEDKQIGKKEFESLWETGNSMYNLEKRYIRKDGEVIWVRITVAPQLDTDGTVLYAIPVIEEITEQKKIAGQIERASRELKITHDFMESVLHIAMHDLRSPVANLHLCIQCIEMQETREAKDKYFVFFKEIVEKLITTLTDLTGILEFLSTKKVNAIPVGLADIIESVIQEQDQSIRNGGIQYTTKVWEIRYIKPFLESLIRNLVSNAVKYRSDKPLKIEINARKEAGYTVICVKDNGIGIDLEQHGESLFQPFRRFTDKASGTGIGLYLIKNIVERNGGFVKLDSKPDVGTTVCCYLKEYEESI